MTENRHGVEDLTGFAMDVIHNAGERALNFYGKGQRQIKFDEGLVTEAELQLTELFEEKLHSRFPDHHLFKDTFESQDYSHIPRHLIIGD